MTKVINIEGYKRDKLCRQRIIAESLTQENLMLRYNPSPQYQGFEDYDDGLHAQGYALKSGPTPNQSKSLKDSFKQWAIQLRCSEWLR